MLISVGTFAKTIARRLGGGIRINLDDYQCYDGVNNQASRK